MLLKKEINISINSSNSAAKKKKMNKENENSINKKEIVEKIKTISENVNNCIFLFLYIVNNTFKFLYIKIII